MSFARCVGHVERNGNGEIISEILRTDRKKEKHKITEDILMTAIKTFL